MTKTNRFVLLQSKGNIPLHGVITSAQVPVVTANKNHAQQFKGYVMSITFSSDTPACDPTEGEGNPEGPLFNIDPCSFVMLAEDLEEFTETMNKADDGQFKGLFSFLKISVQLGPNIADELPHYKDSLGTFFTENIHKSLLQPIRSVKWAGLSQARIAGLVDDTIAADVRKQHLTAREVDPEAYIVKMQGFLDTATELYKGPDKYGAYMQWGVAACDVEQRRGSRLWSRLIEAGGRPFLTKISSMY